MILNHSNNIDRDRVEWLCFESNETKQILINIEWKQFDKIQLNEKENEISQLTSLCGMQPWNWIDLAKREEKLEEFAFVCDWNRFAATIIVWMFSLECYIYVMQHGFERICSIMCEWVCSGTLAHYVNI